MPEPNPHRPDLPDALIEQALVLAERSRMTPGSEAVQGFANQSAAHAEAMAYATKFYAVASRVRAQRDRKPSLNRWLHLLWARVSQPHVAATAIPTLVVVLGLTYWSGTDKEIQTDADVALAQTQTEQFSSAARQQKSATLRDGSTVWLDWHTQLTVHHRPDERLVHLDRGVAAFDVQSEANRPFRVRANRITIEVTGTEFVVNKHAPERVEIAVLEGQVRVTDARGKIVELTAEDVLIADSGIAGAVSRRPASTIGQWRDGMLVFDDRPLIDAIKAIEPYINLQIDTRMIADHPGSVTGVFFIDQAKDALASITNTHKLATEQRGRVLTLKPNPPARP
ncbi:MAG: FecR domain-containing protein [Pseudomonadota bacterium]